MLIIITTAVGVRYHTAGLGLIAVYINVRFFFFLSFRCGAYYNASRIYLNFSFYQRMNKATLVTSVAITLHHKEF